VLFLGRTGRKAEADLVMAQFRANAGSAGIAVEDDVFRELPLVPFEAGERPRQTIGFCTAADGVRIAHA
jgi:hypothetical protein